MKDKFLGNRFVSLRFRNGWGHPERSKWQYLFSFHCIFGTRLPYRRKGYLGIAILGIELTLMVYLRGNNPRKIK